MVWDEEQLKEFHQKIRDCGDDHDFKIIEGFEQLERCHNCGLLNFVACPPSHKNCPGDPYDCREV